MSDPTPMIRRTQPRPAAPYGLTLRVRDIALGLAAVATLAGLIGYGLGAASAATVAARAEALAIDAEATLAQARALCGRTP